MHWSGWRRWYLIWLAWKALRPAVPALESDPERAAWDFKAIVEGTLPALPRQRFGIADVRDVADAHIKAMAVPETAGRRYLLLADGPTITWRGLAETLRDRGR